MRRLFPLSFLVTAAFGCKTTKELDPCVLASSDVRVDSTGEGDQIESDGTLMCVSPTGKIYVAWVDDRGLIDAIWFNTSTDGGVSWLNSDVQVNQGSEGSDGESNIFNPAMACTEDHVYVAWEDDRDGELQNHNIYFNSSDNGGQKWGEVDILLEDDLDGRSFSQAPFIAAGDKNVYVGWFGNDNGAYDIFVNHSEDNGATWEVAPTRVDSDEPAGIAYSAYPRLVALNDDATLYAVWEDARLGKNDIYFAKSTNSGGTFTTDIRLDGGDDPGEHDSFSPQIAADGSNIYVVWFDGRNANESDGPRDIYANYSLDGGNSWQPSATIVEADLQNAPGFFNSRFPVVAVKGGEAVVAWEDARNNGYDIYARRMVNGTPEGDETRLDGGNATEPSGIGQANSLRPVLASASSNVVVMWADDRSTLDPESGFADLFYNCSYDFGKTWDLEDRRIDNVEAGASFKLNLNLALVGETITAAWADGRTGSSDIYVHVMKKGEEADYVVVGNPDECVREEPTPSETTGTTRTSR